MLLKLLEIYNAQGLIKQALTLIFFMPLGGFTSLGDKIESVKPGFLDNSSASYPQFLAVLDRGWEMPTLAD